ncbi:hypothetical protein GQX73_g8986 [Xylaria multiplex]|uniref:Uncharacterized protein n=1 Tax=Xylaria multiplex TaxID=323545 RepID=A0A7C8IRD0_9PEZI|nr:hypothetical protein GQX73_g8986 [Xylaria multiplex]
MHLGEHRLPITNAGSNRSRWYHQSQIKNDILFIDGGITSYSDRQQFDNPKAHDDRLNYTGPVTVGTSTYEIIPLPVTFKETNLSDNYIITVDLSVSWDWKTNISEKFVEKTAALGTSNLIPIVQSGALFQGNPNDPQIYLYGGVTPDINTSFADWQGPTTNQYTLWGLNTQTFGWTQYDVSLTVPERPSWGFWAEIPDQGQAFYMNGLVNNLSSASTRGANIPETNLEGMVVLDLQHRTALNRSTEIITSGNPRARGGMVYIPDIGSNGILISLGGATGHGDSLQPVLMNMVYIYDVNSTLGPDSTTSSNGWWTQTIDGAVPSPRVDFCTVVVSAPDRSSFNIHLYGGWDPIKHEEFDEIWVLSIPSFTWIKVYKGVFPRWGHTCHIVGQRQMISVGGTNSTDYPETCDWEWMGVAVLDLSEMAWGSIFDRDKPPYQVNPMISDIIGGGLDGGATMLRPESGWSNTHVAQLFTGTMDQTAYFIPPGASEPNGTTGSAGSNRAGGTNIGAIVGGTVGGVAFLLLLALGLWWLIRKAKSPGQQQQNNYSSPKPEGEQPQQPAMVELDASQAPTEIQGDSAYELYGNMQSPPGEMEGGQVWYSSGGHPQ